MRIDTYKAYGIEQLVLFRFNGDGDWMVRTNKTETIEVMGTNIIPTPFKASVAAVDVQRIIAEMNPEAMVQIEIPAASREFI